MVVYPRDQTIKTRERPMEEGAISMEDPADASITSTWDRAGLSQYGSVLISFNPCLEFRILRQT